MVCTVHPVVPDPERAVDSVTLVEHYVQPQPKFVAEAISDAIPHNLTRPLNGPFVTAARAKLFSLPASALSRKRATHIGSRVAADAAPSACHKRASLDKHVIGARCVP